MFFCFSLAHHQFGADEFPPILCPNSEIIYAQVNAEEYISIESLTQFAALIYPTNNNGPVPLKRSNCPKAYHSWNDALCNGNQSVHRSSFAHVEKSRIAAEIYSKSRENYFAHGSNWVELKVPAKLEMHKLSRAAPEPSSAAAAAAHHKMEIILLYSALC